MTKRTLYTLVFEFLLFIPNRGKAESVPNDSLVLDLQSVIQIAFGTERQKLIPCSLLELSLFPCKLPTVYYTQFLTLYK